MVASYEALSASTARIRTTKTIVERIQQATPAALHIYKKRGGFVIHLLSLPESERGQGYGTVILRVLCDFADRMGHMIGASPVDERTARLYTRFGFEPVDADGGPFYTSLLRQPEVAETDGHDPKIGSTNFSEKD